MRIFQIQVKSWSNFISHPSLLPVLCLILHFYIVILTHDYIILNDDNRNSSFVLIMKNTVDWHLIGNYVKGHEMTLMRLQKKNKNIQGDF